MTQGEVIQKVFSRIPSSDCISELDTEKGYKSFTFSWMGARYKIDYSLGSIHVDEVQGGFLKGSDKAMLMKQLLNAKP